MDIRRHCGIIRVPRFPMALLVILKLLPATILTGPAHAQMTLPQMQIYEAMSDVESLTTGFNAAMATLKKHTERAGTQPRSDAPVFPAPYVGNSYESGRYRIGFGHLSVDFSDECAAQADPLPTGGIDPLYAPLSSPDGEDRVAFQIKRHQLTAADLPSSIDQLALRLSGADARFLLSRNPARLFGPSSIQSTILDQYGKKGSALLLEDNDGTYYGLCYYNPRTRQEWFASELVRRVQHE